MKLILINAGKILAIVASFYIVCAVGFVLVGGDRAPKTVQFLNQTNRRLMISYWGKDGENQVSLKTMVLPFETLNLSRLLTGEPNGQYSITVSPAEKKSKSKTANLEWNGVPKGIALAYKLTDEIVWVKH